MFDDVSQVIFARLGVEVLNEQSRSQALLPSKISPIYTMQINAEWLRTAFH